MLKNPEPNLIFLFLPYICITGFAYPVNMKKIVLMKVQNKIYTGMHFSLFRYF